MDLFYKATASTGFVSQNSFFLVPRRGTRKMVGSAHPTVDSEGDGGGKGQRHGGGRPGARAALRGCQINMGFAGNAQTRAWGRSGLFLWENDVFGGRLALIQNARRRIGFARSDRVGGVKNAESIGHRTSIGHGTGRRVVEWAICSSAVHSWKYPVNCCG